MDYVLVAVVAFIAGMAVMAAIRTVRASDQGIKRASYEWSKSYFEALDKRIAEGREQNG